MQLISLIDKIILAERGNNETMKHTAAINP